MTVSVRAMIEKKRAAAKKRYRLIAMIQGLKDVCIASHEGY